MAAGEMSAFWCALLLMVLYSKPVWYMPQGCFSCISAMRLYFQDAYVMSHRDTLFLSPVSATGLLMNSGEVFPRHDSCVRYRATQHHLHVDRHVGWCFVQPNTRNLRSGRLLLGAATLSVRRNIAMSIVALSPSDSPAMMGNAAAAAY